MLIYVYLKIAVLIIEFTRYSLNNESCLTYRQLFTVIREVLLLGFQGVELEICK